MCMLCPSKGETRFICLYVFGSEGLTVCHTCEMKLVEFARQLRSKNMPHPTKPEKATRHSQDGT